MVTMTPLPTRRRWDRHELEALPDDGNRYELIDGVLVVSPAPRWRHQRVSFRLGQVLGACVPDGLEVLAAPFDVILGDDSVLQPDLLVARVEALAERGLVGPPLLAIEILSPGTASIDRHVKKDRLRRAGCPHYWIVDPDEPSITAWHLAVPQDGGEPDYALAGRPAGSRP